ncbi:oxidoreductase [Aquisalimonas lutea]|uniref:oxidoreductase n=1 Tax=Aquisalimonas lutea TaxID=1327750 RepID=UPI0025B5F43A|nr:oxidoreductase [Aquisalimonas lutea]MDN3516545.1 oxidoreductase [Aquisalimonas lutea]
MSTGQRWFITGCSTGLGRALAEAVLDNGGRAVITARDPRSLDPLVERYGDRAVALALDLNRPDQVAEAARRAASAYDGLDVLVNNAGYGLVGAVEETDPAEYRPLFETNFFATVELTRALLPLFRRQRRGRIINISSIAAMAPRPGYGFYAATKAALEAVSESLAQELRPLGIAVTLVEPGPFRTDWAGRSLQLADTAIDDYADTSGASRQAVRERNGRQAGDPARAARVIMAAAQAEQPPLRLPLGSFPYRRMREKLGEIEGELAQWEDRAGAAVEFD